MAGVKITDLNALTTPDPADLFAIVDDVAGTAETKKITLQNAIEIVNALSAITAPAGTDEILIMDDPGGTLAAKKITLANLLLGSTGIIPQARVYNSVNISISNGTPVNLTADSERWDTDGIHSTISNLDRLVCQTAGTYIIFGNAAFAANVNGRRRLLLRLNAGATNIAVDQRNASVSGTTTCTIVTKYRLSVSDYVVFAVYQDSGGSLNVEASLNNSPEFGMIRVGD